MKIRFDPDFDGGAWPGPLGAGDREASAGEEWLGELGLVGRLETALGLGGPTPTPGERAAALVPALRDTDGFWSRSVAVDPLGSARELLRWREHMAAHLAPRGETWVRDARPSARRETILYGPNYPR